MKMHSSLHDKIIAASRDPISVIYKHGIPPILIVHLKKYIYIRNIIKIIKLVRIY